MTGEPAVRGSRKGGGGGGDSARGWAKIVLAVGGDSEAAGASESCLGGTEVTQSLA